jgi:hypothetical protein
VNNNGLYGIIDGAGTNDIAVRDGPLKAQMGWEAASGTPFLVSLGPDLRPYRYIDFVSDQLTYNQNLKDATSNLRDQSVLVRWYFAYDNPSPTDAYGLAKIINPDGVPKFYGAFRDLVMNKITQFKWIPKPNAQNVIHEALQPAIRFTKEECLDLPDMTYTFRETPLSAQQLKFYEAIKRDMLTIAAGESITTVNAAANLNKLLQLSCGAVYSDTGEVIAFDAGGRLSALLEVIEEASHKVIIFAPFRHAIEIIADELKAKGIPAEKIHGGISATKRTEIFNSFQTEENPQVLVIQPQAAAHGVTLHAANVVVWWGPITSIETYLQDNARVHRAGQRNPCTVVHLQGSPVEKKIYKMLSEKEDIHTRLIDLYKNIMEDT